MPVQVDKLYDGDDIVISGISGSFPLSDDIEEFKKNLFDGKDMISTVERWDRSEAFRRMGEMKNTDRFDHEFFNISREQTESMATSTRLLLERTFEAIIDAGYNSKQIKRKRIAVVCGESDAFMNEKKLPETKEGRQSRFHCANFVSYWLDLNGPSVTLDSACSGSIFALDYAIKAIQNGDCDGALVSASNLCILPSDEYFEIGILSPTGVCRPLDADGDGFVRAESTTVVFLQKRKDARRIYANIISCKTNCDGFTAEGIMSPSVQQQKELYATFYKEININPSVLSFVEAHGTGTKVGDITEGTSLEEFFCANRETPLKIGSVKSNMGHGEAAAALCSLIKMIISFEEGMIPANLYFHNPNPKIKGLHNGKLQVLTKSIPVEGEYFAINSFGVGGANGHILISPHNKIKKSDHALVNDGLPRLVTVSGRTEKAVDCVLNEAMKNHMDFEYIRLIHEIFSENTDGYSHRGYVILNQNGNHATSKKFLKNEKERPLWFIFSDVGSQWSALSASLMKILPFAESVGRSHKILYSKGVNLMEIITSNDPLVLRNVLNSNVGTVAVQIALVDVLKALGIEPDGMIGHSIGEIACAYADECLTAEQAILIAYYYGLTSFEAKFIHSTKIVVNQCYSVMKTLVTSKIDITSDDHSDCCTISGPTEVIQEIIEELNTKNISIREVRTSNIAYDRHFITLEASKLISHFEKIIPEPKLRSKKWSYASALEHHSSTDELKYCSARYFINNFTETVNFEKSYSQIPNDAIVIEIGPHGFLNDILKCLPPSSAENIALMTKNCKNSIEFFLSALGKMYESGYAMKLSNLYPSVKFPVSKSTPMISPSIKWKHDEIWKMRHYNDQNSTSTIQDSIINMKSSASEYITGHIIDERNLFPGLGYLELIWINVANMLHTKVDTLPIVFENVRFERATNVPKNGILKFSYTIHLGTNTFEITENKALVASGNVRIPKDIKKEVFDVKPFEDEISNSDILPLSTKDFYKELRLKGYHYKGMFKKVVCVNAEGTYGRVSWENNFTTFMDTMAQVTIMKADCRELLIPTYIRELVIDVDKHYKILETLDKENPEFAVNYYPTLDLLSSGGIQISGFGTNEIARRPDKADPVLEVQKFVPYISEQEMNITSAVRLCVHIALENTPQIKVKTYELLDQEYTEGTAPISNYIAKSLTEIPLIRASVNVLTESPNLTESGLPHGITVSSGELSNDHSTLLIILSNIRDKTKIYDKIFKALKKDGFIITKESRGENNPLKDFGFEVCFRRIINTDEEILLLKKITQPKLQSNVIRIKNDSYTWIPKVQTALTNIKPENNEELVIYSEKERMSGIIGFFSCLRKEENGKGVRCFFIADDTAPEFSLDSSFYKTQSDKNLSQNVFKNGQWGSYRHVPFVPVKEIETISSFCMLEKRADFSSFKWVEDSLGSKNDNKNSNEKLLIHTYYSSLNFKDIMLAIGKISMSNQKFLYSRLDESYLGFEFSGKDENGRRIMGIVKNKGIATMIETDSNSTWMVPDHFSLEEAASIPVIYFTVVYALFFRTELKKGASILIHAGSGGIGQAAINICLHYGCNIFTTVGTPEKIKFIRKTYPQIPESHICNSRDKSFETVIMQQTNGKGVDIVLNSLSDEKLKASLRCVRKGGHFLEIGKFDMARNNCIELAQFLKNITFHSIQVDLSKWGFGGQLDSIRDKMQNMLDEGVIKPIKGTIFHYDEVESAFRYMAAGKHIGKVIIKIRDEEEDAGMKPVALVKKAKPRVLCKQNKSYVIVGGLGGFGLELADWLILRGARNIVLSSRTGVKKGYQSYRIKLWRSYNVNVVISTDDVTNEAGAKKLLMTANSLGTVGGIFNVALVLKDDPFLKQTDETFSAVAAPKAIATAHLDKLSREICPDLEHFVVFSSVACGRGNLNQTNYGFSNSIMERICESRNDDNLPALAIQWGAIGEVGVVADFAEDNLNFVIGGTLQQNVRSCLDSLNSFMKQSNPVVSSMVVAEKYHADSNITNTIANILGLKDLDTISLIWTLPELGMDSIMAVEIKEVLESEFNVFFTQEDLKTMTFAKLNKLKEEKKNSPKSGEKMKSQLQKTIMAAKSITEPFLRIPFDYSEVKKSQGCEDRIPFIFPGVEGMASFIEPLAKNLALQAICFQYYGDTFPMGSLREMGEYFVKFILKALRSDEEFIIIGYSLGVFFALEAVCILEEKGRKGCVYLIEGSPLFFAAKAAQHLDKNKSNILYVENSNDLESVKKLLCSVTSSKSINETFLNNLLEMNNKFCKISQNYELNYDTLDTPCTLIRVASDDYDLDESYGLTKYFKNPVQIHKIEANHQTILEHPKTSQIIRNCPLLKST